jgi:type II secretory ATPase GspE/PulE/Tfp pilus assembly ATPase PilB-like protein
MKFADKLVRQILLEGNYISEADLNKAEDFAKAHRTSLIDYLLAEELISRDLLGQALAESFKVPYADLNSKQPSQAQVLQIPEALAKKFRAILFSHQKSKVVITTDNPAQANLLSELQAIFPQEKIVINFSLPEDIDSSLVNYQKSLETRFSKIIKEQKQVAPEILEEIFNDALVFHASDIHFEPQGEEILVRFRVDGVLQDAGRLPKDNYENILNRIKVQSGLRIDEHFSAQDGSMRFVKEDTQIDLRTSIIPTVEGEKIVLRVLGSYVQGFNLGDLGLSVIQQRLLEEAATKPFGMIVVAGPTGSGKTTTLYALLKLLNQPGVNVTTIEDPVEYKMAGVNQIQVNAATNLTFAKGLRSIVRQDPDIILVGEIRDEETAEIAVNAALTGHLLLSTFHANDAATAIPRLLDMGVEPFLLSSTLELIIAQRLVRKICDQCRYSLTVSHKDIVAHHKGLERFFPEASLTLYQGKGCEACGHSGYKDRTAIFEFLAINGALRNLILKNPSTQEIWRLARGEGAQTFFEDGVAKVKNGLTTLEELLRVAEPPDIL